MTTGDVRAAVAALQTALRSVRFPEEFDTAAGEAGSPGPLLPALDYLLLRFSKHIAALLVEQGLQLHGLSDLRFVEGVFKFVRDVLGMRPALTPAQFLCEGYAERKVQLVHSIATTCRELHNAAARKERLAVLKGQHPERRYGVATVAPVPQQQQQQQVGMKRQGQSKRCGSGGSGGTNGILRPPPPSPHLGVATELLESAAAEAAVAAGGPGHQQQSGSGGDADKPRAVAGAAAEEAPAGSPVILEQPRLLPSPLLSAQQLRRQQPEEGVKAAAAGSCIIASCGLGVHGYPQLKAAGCPTRLLLPPVQHIQQMPAQPPVGGPDQLVGTWRAEQQATQQPAAVDCCAAQQAVGAEQTATLWQTGAQVQPQQQLASVWPQTGSSSSGSELQAWRLMEELQLRLGLAEEAAAAARQEAQQVREQLQARVTVLEGRVRFLEAGYELRPPLQQLQVANEPQGQLRPQQQAPALWLGLASSCGSGLGTSSSCWTALPAAGVTAGGAPGLCAGQVMRPTLASGQVHTHVGAPQLMRPASFGQITRNNPLFDKQAVPAGADIGSSAAAQFPPESVGVGSSSFGQPSAAAAHQQLLPASPAAPATATAQRSYSTTSDLIVGMQARFSEAQDFLLSLQRL